MSKTFLPKRRFQKRKLNFLEAFETGRDGWLQLTIEIIKTGLKVGFQTKTGGWGVGGHCSRVV